MGAVCQPHGTREGVLGEVPEEETSGGGGPRGHPQCRDRQGHRLDAKGVAPSEQVPGNLQLIRRHDRYGKEIIQHYYYF